MAFPGPKVHRVSRRKLGRGQHQQLPLATTTAATATPVVTLTFSVPVIVSGPLEFSIAGQTIISQVQTSPTTYTFNMSGTTTSSVYDFPGNQPNIATFQGGGVQGVAGTF